MIDSDDDSDFLTRAAGAIAAGSLLLGSESLQDEEAGEFPQLPGIVLLERIGQGGMGVVFKAQQLEPDRTVAVKFPRLSLADQKMARRFKSEVALLARLEHPSIARVYEARVYGGWPYMVMEYVEGMPLDTHVKSNHTEVREVLVLMREAAEAVAFIHQHGVLHHDLKPSNILVSDGKVKIVDFGLAGRFQTDSASPEEFSGTGFSVNAQAGTFHYLAPELIEGRPNAASPRADVYALGVILYRLLTGSFPHATGTTEMETLRNITEQPPRHPHTLQPGLPWDICLVMMKAVAREPENRYESASALAQDLGNFLERRPVLARSPAWGYVARKHLMRNWKFWLAGAALVLAGLAQLISQTRFAQQELKTNVALVKANDQLEVELSRADTERGLVFMQKGESDMALAYFAKALRVNPRNSVASRAAANTVIHGKLPVFMGEESLAGRLLDLTQEPKLRTLAKRDPTMPQQYFFATEAGIERWNVQTGKHLETLVIGRESPARGLAFDIRADGFLVAVQGRQAAVFKATKDKVQELQRLELDTEVRWVQLSPGWGYVALLSKERDECQIGQWKSQRLQMLHRLAGEGVFRPERPIVFANDSRLLVAFDQDGTRLVRWKLDTGEALPKGDPCPDFNPNAPNLAPGWPNNTVVSVSVHQVMVFDAVSGNSIHSENTPGDLWPGVADPAAIYSITHSDKSGNGKLVALGGGDQRVRVVNAETGQPACRAGLVARHIHAVSLGDNGQDGVDRLLALDYGDTDTHGLTLWDWRRAEMLAPRMVIPPAHAAGWAGSGHFFAALEPYQLQRWRLPPLASQALAVLSGWTGHVSVDDAWQTFVFSSSLGEARSGALQPGVGPAMTELWLHRPPAETATEDGEGDSGFAKISPDGAWVVTWNNASKLEVTQRAPMDLKPWTISAEGARIHCCAFSADSHFLAVGMGNGGLTVWDVTRGEKVYETLAYQSPITRLTFSPSGYSQHYLTAGISNGRAKVWDCSAWKELPSVGNVPAGIIKRLIFHPKEPVLLVQLFGPLVGIPMLLRARLGAELIWDPKPISEGQGAAKALALSPDGKLVAVGNVNGRISIRAWSGDKELRHFEAGHEINDIAFNSEGTSLVGGGGSNLLHLWDAATGEQIMPEITMTEGMHMLRMSPEGNEVVHANSNGLSSLVPIFTSAAEAPPWFVDWIQALARLELTPGQIAPKRLAPVTVSDLDKMIPVAEKSPFTHMAHTFLQRTQK